MNSQNIGSNVPQSGSSTGGKAAVQEPRLILQLRAKDGTMHDFDCVYFQWQEEDKHDREQLIISIVEHFFEKKRQIFMKNYPDQDWDRYLTLTWRQKFVHFNIETRDNIEKTADYQHYKVKKMHCRCVPTQE